MNNRTGEFTSCDLPDIKQNEKKKIIKIKDGDKYNQMNSDLTGLKNSVYLVQMW